MKQNNQSIIRRIINFISYKEKTVDDIWKDFHKKYNKIHNERVPYLGTLHEQYYNNLIQDLKFKLDYELYLVTERRNNNAE